MCEILCNPSTFLRSCPEINLKTITCHHHFPLHFGNFKPEINYTLSLQWLWFLFYNWKLKFRIIFKHFNYLLNLYYNFLKCIHPWNKFEWENWLPALEEAVHVGGAPILLSQVQKFTLKYGKTKQVLQSVYWRDGGVFYTFTYKFLNRIFWDSDISESIMSSSEHCKFKIFYKTF